MGFLYVDGHVRVYHGERPLPKTHTARMPLPMPGTSDYWVNDATGEPLFVVTAEANAGLVKMLPVVLDEVRILVGERRITVVFDRGGWSPRLFRTLVAEGYRMFARWRQENFFKYLREEYALDALVDYAVEPDNAAREVPNPAWNTLTAELREARAEMARLAANLGIEALANPEFVHKTVRGFKIVNSKLGQGIWAALRRVTELETRRAKVPPRVPVQEVVEGQVVKLATERKHLTNLLKMVAYQAESDLVRLVAPHYRRVEQEGRTLIQSALAAPADIEVTDSELRILLAPLSSAHRTRAIAALCKELNGKGVRFPGTKLRLRFTIGGPR